MTLSDEKFSREFKTLKPFEYNFCYTLFTALVKTMQKFYTVLKKNSDIIDCGLKKDCQTLVRVAYILTF